MLNSVKSNKKVIILFISQVIVYLISILINTFYFPLINFWGGKNGSVEMASIATRLAILSLIASFGTLFIRLDTRTRQRCVCFFLLLSLVTTLTPFLDKYYVKYVYKPQVAAREREREAQMLSTARKNFLEETERLENKINRAKLNNNKFYSLDVVELMDYGIGANHLSFTGDNDSSRALGVVRRAFEANVIDPNARLISNEDNKELGSTTVYFYLVGPRSQLLGYPSIYEEVAQNTLDVLKMYVEFGADVNQKDLRGRTIIDHIRLLEDQIRNKEQNRSIYLQ